MQICPFSMFILGGDPITSGTAVYHSYTDTWKLVGDTKYATSKWNTVMRADTRPSNWTIYDAAGGKTKSSKRCL